MKSFRDLREYQHWLIRKMRKLKVMLLAIDMGMGKTAICLYAIKSMLLIDVRRVLVVAPKRVATETWPDELNQWKELRSLTYTVMTGTPKQRALAFRKNADIYIINRENLPWLWRHIKSSFKKGKITKFPFDTMIWDESSGLKSWSKRASTSGKMNRFGVASAMRKYLDRVYELTGTPAPNGVIDLGGQMYILDQGERLGQTKDAFLKRWFDTDYMGYEYTPKAHAFDDIMDRCCDVMYSLRAEDYIDLPKQLVIPRYVKLPSKLMREYEKFERTLYSETYDVEAVSSGVLTNKLLQFANGSMYRNIEGEKRKVVHIHDYKLDELERIYEEANGASILCAYGYEFDVDRIMKKFPKAVYEGEDRNFIKHWNSGKMKLGLVHPASLGHGTNIQFGGHIQVWYGLTWSLELWQQFNKRLPRSGQKAHTCFCYPIVARNTVDETVLATMQLRGATQDKVHAAVKARIRNAAEETEKEFHC